MDMKRLIVFFSGMWLMLAGCAPHAPLAVPASPAEIASTVKASDAPLTLVHVWATWCPPCRVEFPELIRVHRKFSREGLNLILISADEPGDAEQVGEFLVQQACPVDSLITTELSQRFIEQFSPNWGGALPASFFYVDGALRAEWEGMRSFKQYANTIRELMGGDEK